MTVNSSMKLELGGQQYEVAPLTVLKARAWREKLITSARALSQSLFRETNGHDETFFAGLGSAYLAFPDTLCEMIFAYAPDLPRDEILSHSTDQEMIAAFAEIVRVAFPYLHHLSLMATFDIAARMDEAELENLQGALVNSIAASPDRLITR